MKNKMEFMLTYAGMFVGVMGIIGGIMVMDPLIIMNGGIMMWLMIITDRIGDLIELKEMKDEVNSNGGKK